MALRKPRFFIPLLAACLCMTLGAGAALGDVVHLKDGKKIEGTVVGRTASVIRIKDAAGRIHAFSLSKVKKVETDSDVMPSGDDERLVGDPMRRETERIEEALGRKLDVVVKTHVHVRGDHPPEELEQVADAAEMTVLHFMDVFQCEAGSFLKGSGRYAGRIEVFQFRQEKNYLRYMDKVFDRLRDRRTVSDELFKYMRRQRGHWVVDPRPITAGYMGPSPFATIPANHAHKVSHILLDQWEISYWKPRPWWLYEGLATWQEIQIMGRNLTYCLEPARPGGYANQGNPEADELKKAQTASLWRKHVRAKVKAREERMLGVLARLPLNDLNRDEVIQSWSVVDWIWSKGKLRDFVLALKRTQDLEQALNDTLGYGIDGAHEHWRRWVLGPGRK